MTKEKFRQLYKYVNAVYYGDYIVFKVNKHRWELYNTVTEETAVFKSFDEISANETVEKIISEYVEEEIKLDMPKGDRSGATDTFGDGGGNGRDDTTNDFPSRVNTDKQKSTEDKTLQQFRKMYANDFKEHGFAVDEQGYITTYKHGNKSSVSWSASELQGKMIYHNHPNSSAFSKADMITTAKTGARGIVASGKNGDYIFRKTQKFDSVGFQKAVSNAKTISKDYNIGVDRWLKMNAKKYGYTYEFRHA
ncbi:MAG: hypothetical protein ACI4XH_07895 [Acutalibacteraceae bacterium]